MDHEAQLEEYFTDKPDGGFTVPGDFFEGILKGVYIGMRGPRPGFWHPFKRRAWDRGLEKILGKVL